MWTLPLEELRSNPQNEFFTKLKATYGTFDCDAIFSIL